MPRMNAMVFSILILTACILSGCTHANSDVHTLPAETIVTETNYIETLPATTEPVPTDPPKFTSPPFVAEAGSYIDSYYSDEYQDYLDYYIHVPKDAADGMPLIVFLHGDGEVGRIDLLPEFGLISHSVEIYGESFPYILLEPNTRIESWTKGNIPELLFELINYIADYYNIDTDKIILTGFSRGAIGVWDMISIYGGYFSAAVPVSSPHQKGHIDYIKAAEVPVWTFAGDIGETERWYHQYLRQNVDIIMGCEGYGKFTVLKGCNHSKAKYAAYVKETFDWMLAQTRGVIPEA